MNTFYIDTIFNFETSIIILKIGKTDKTHKFGLSSISC